MRKVGVACIALLLSLGSLTACSNQDQSDAKPLHPLKEAYQLLDAGETAKAIVILKDYLRQHPDHAEARMVLASAFLGEAGVDVFTVFDSFQDILFKKTLADTFWNARPDPAPAQPADGGSSGGSAPDPESAEAHREAPVLQLVLELDEMLETLRKTGSLLSRFPEIKKKNWVLLRTGLEQLDKLAPSKDVALYKTFIRVIQIRAFLKSELLLNDGLNQRDWICGLKPEKFREDVQWLSEQLFKTADDYKVAQPDRAVNLDGLYRLSGEVLRSLDALDERTPDGLGLSEYTAHSRIRNELRCD